MVTVVAALALGAWTHPLSFRPLAGWRTGSSGTTVSRYSGTAQVRGRQSSAWIARNVRYRDGPDADPPNRTLAHLPSDGVIVWAVAFEPAGMPQRPIALDLARARRLDCCEATSVPGGMYELTGAGRGGSYSTIVRVYFGSRPTAAARAAAQRALDRLVLPPTR
jgi:hypothetical protein